MRYKLAEEFLHRQVQIVRWKSLFVVIGTIAAITVLYQQDIPFRLLAGAGIVASAGWFIWKYHDVLNHSLSRAQNVWIDVDEEAITCRHEIGQSEFRLNSISKFKMSQQVWPVLIITFNDHTSIKLQGFEGIADLSAVIQERIHTDAT
jgi:hypothetical protein